MGKVRAGIVWLLFFFEALIAAPFFAVSWAVSTIAFALVAGVKFAKMEDEKTRRNILTQMLGGSISK